ncbi:MAG: phage replisome organizer N-terminal domain-containing protein [Oscillospiraceae bacterium]|nr:phage replisome organizer N-terminal domain-containing protein [Oscillospiraceae bacterium]
MIYIPEITWIKLSTDLFNNRKIRQIQNLPKGDTILVIWLKLLILAGQINDGGRVYVTPEIPYTIRSLAAEMQRSPAVVQSALDCFVRFDMAQVDAQGFLFLPGWQAHQNVDGMERIREQNRERKRKQRAAQKASADGHVTVTGRHAAEEEKESEKDEEKEFHSCIHAREADEGLSKQMTYLGGELGQGVVLLSDEQMEDLLQKMSLEEFHKYVSIVAQQELAGKHYKKKTHYRAILDMALADRKLR